MNILPVVLAGGVGSRLWPMSRELHPKQFLPITSDKSLLQETLLRVEGIKGIADPIVVCNEEHRFLVAEQLREINCKAQSIILEPIGKNTAPAAALAALESLEKVNDQLLLILPADHVISDIKKSHQIINSAIESASSGSFVTFGATPVRPETGFGYIQLEESNESVKQVIKFIEKPDLQTAEKLIKDNFLWNSGIFLVKASVYLDLLAKFKPKLYELCKSAHKSAQIDFDFLRVNKDEFSKIDSISIDYAILEKTNEAVVIPFDTGWSDLSSWSSLWEVLNKDANGNVSKGDVTLKYTEDSMVIGSRRQVCTLGVKDLVIVETDTSVLVADKNKVERIKDLTDMLKADGRNEIMLHRQVCRPWGKFDSIDHGERFQVKHITVNPGEKLSKQMHYHRAEHWIVVSGTAKVLNGESEMVLTENQSTYIPLGTIHSLENPGNIPLEIIEVQSGTYLGEDDIVRFEDRYGRLS